MGAKSELAVLIDHDRELEHGRADEVIASLMSGLRSVRELGEDYFAYQFDPYSYVRKGVREVLAVRFPGLLLKAASMVDKAGQADWDQLIQAALDANTSPREALTKALENLDFLG